MLKKIFILEDEPVLSHLYNKNLSVAGYEVKCCESVEESLKVLENFKPDLLFVDHGIQGEEKSGLDFINEYKKNYPDIPMAMLTNYSNSELQREAEQAGVKDFLIKLNTPPKELVHYVDRLLQE